MPKFVVRMIDAYTRNILDTEDEVFDNEDDTEEYACECGGNFAEGAEVLKWAGREFTPPEDVEFIVDEIDD